MNEKLPGFHPLQFPAVPADTERGTVPLKKIWKIIREPLLRWSQSGWFWGGAFALCGLVYVLLKGIYLNNDIDNSWTGAWIFNFWNRGITEDIIFFEGDASYWGVRFFSHIFCWIYGFAGMVFGFTRDVWIGVSAFWMLTGFLIWYGIGKILLPNRNAARVFLFLLVLAGVSVAAAMKIRTDAFVFAFNALAFYLFLRGKYFWAVFCACIAVETHPVGICGICYPAAYLLCCRREVFDLRHPGAFLRMAAGGLCGILLYLLLHWSTLAELLPVLSNATSGRSNFLYAHFFGRSSYPWRYLPELLLFAAAFAGHFLVFGRRKFFFPLTVLLFLLFSFLIARGNFHYALFAYPAFLLLTVNLVDRLDRAVPVLLALGWLLLMLPQYSFLIWRNSGGRDFNEYIARLQSVKIPENVRICGMPNDYFAFMKHKGFRTLRLYRPDQEAYIIRHEKTIYMQPDWEHISEEAVRSAGVWKIAEFPLRSDGRISVWHKLPVSRNKPEENDKP